MNDVGYCAQAAITKSALVDRLCIPSQQIGRLLNVAQWSLASPTGGIGIEVGLSVLTQHLCAGLGIDTAELVRDYKPYLRAAMLHVASNPAFWRIQGDDEAALQARLFAQGEGAGLSRRRLQELLGSHDRAINRYLIRRPGQAWSGSDDVDEKIAGGEEPMIWILDAIALANRFSSALSGPFFEWRS